MKIFFIYPIPDSEAHHTLVCRKGYGSAMPLGLGYVAAMLEKEGHEVKIFDFQLEEEKNLIPAIRDYAPDLLGISVLTPSATVSFRIAKTLKTVFPDLPIVAGGPHVTTLKAQVFDEARDFDFLVIGEGEHTTVELVKALGNGGNFAGIKGLAYKDKGVTVVCEERPFIKNLDELPFFPVHLYQYKEYVPTPGTFKRLPSMALLTTRGCPFDCTFCNKSMFSRTARVRSVESVVDEIEMMSIKYGAKEINFYDDLFTMNRKRVIGICEELIRRKIDVAWKCCSRVNCVDPELLSLMKKAGCFIISYGVESGDEYVLEKTRKKITLQEVRDAFRWTREAGILRSAFFILNLPGDSKASIEKTIKFSREIDPDYVSFEMSKPLPGTDIEEELKDVENVKIYRELWDDWALCTISNQIYYTQKDLTDEFLADAFRRAVRGFYLRPAYVTRAFFRLRTWSQFKSYAMAGMNIMTARVPIESRTVKINH